VVAWLLIQVTTQTFPFFDIPNWAVRLVVLLLALGFPLALIFAWAFELTPEGIKRTEDVAPSHSITRRTGRKLTALVAAIAMLAAALFVFGKFKRGGASGAESPAQNALLRLNEKSIAVLPFVNMSSDKENEYFVDGLTEEILNRLAQISALKVPGRTSSFVFKEKTTDLRQVGTALGVAHVLEGSVRKAGERLRITAQLVRTSDGYHLWSQAYDRKLDDVFAIQEEIARAIADALAVQLKLGSNGKSERPTQDMAAYGNYLEARALITQRDTDNLGRAIALLEEAVQRDPRFAKAWAALAQARALGFYYLDVPANESLEGGESAARKALALDESLGTAHCVLANVLRDRDDWLAAEAEYRRALELAAGEAETHNQYAQMLLKVGRLDAALEHANRACELDPLAWIPPSIVSIIQLSKGDLVQARVWLDRLEKLQGKVGGFALRLELFYALSKQDAALARAALAMARSSSAAEWSSAADKKLIDVMDRALAARDDRSEPPPDLVATVREMAASEAPSIVGELAAVAVFVGQPDAAFAAFAFGMRSPGGLDPLGIWTPPLQPLRRDPRFLAVLKELQMPTYWRAAGWPNYCRAKGQDDFECIAP
jgi:TolB-like protein/Tfp pilus assembly protein PilF